MKSLQMEDFTGVMLEIEVTADEFGFSRGISVPVFPAEGMGVWQAG